MNKMNGVGVFGVWFKEEHQTDISIHSFSINKHEDN